MEGEVKLERGGVCLGTLGEGSFVVSELIQQAADVSCRLAARSVKQTGAPLHASRQMQS